MAQLVKRARSGGGNSYRVRWRLNGSATGAWQSVTYREQATAKSVKAAVEARGHRVRSDAPEVRDLTLITGGRSVRAGAPTFGEVAQRYIDTRPALKDNTREKYQGVLDRDLTCWTTVPIDSIMRADVEELVGRMHRAGRSVTATFDFARSVFRHAVNSEPPLRAGNPCAGVKLPRGKGRTQNFLTVEEADLLLDFADDEARPMIEVMLNTGLRTRGTLGAAGR